ncbi:MAG: peptidoglycan editing factor PgeF [Melioribacteraceae bacterium]|nr:peptidoglycan editing factor PgeF [Melioribacteraceae bacterium]
MVILQSYLLKKFSNIKFGMSTKVGKQKEAPYYFNLSKSVGDNEKVVEANRKEFFEKFLLAPRSVKLQKQIHSDIITYVDKNSEVPESDALITDKPQIGLAAITADCPTIFLYDNVKKVIGAVHSGWRGTEKRILAKTVTKMITDFKSEPSNMYAYIAPSISQNFYEVGNEVAEKFDKRFLIKVYQHNFLDLKKCNLTMLVTLGVPYKNIQVSELCSFELKHLFHSYRRDGEKSGRSLGMIMMKD